MLHALHVKPVYGLILWPHQVVALSTGTLIGAWLVDACVVTARSALCTLVNVLALLSIASPAFTQARQAQSMDSRPTISEPASSSTKVTSRHLTASMQCQQRQKGK